MSCAAFDQYLDRIGVIPGASMYPFVWGILLSARNEGYGGVLTTMAVAEEPRVKELLGIPDDYAIAALLPIGKPVKQVSKLTRKPVSEIAVQERFDGQPFGPATRLTLDNSSALSQTQWRLASSPWRRCRGTFGFVTCTLGYATAEHRRAEPRGSARGVERCGR